MSNIASKNIFTVLNTIIDFIRYGITEAQRYQVFYGHGTDNPWDDIWSLISGLLNLPFDCNPIIFHANLTLEEKNIIFEKLQQRIIERIPVPYLLKKASFCDLSFYVDERVLIPRSPIAELIRQQFSPWIDPNNISKILDMCTGSGCIAIACCYNFDDITVDAVDISADALAVAKINCDNHHLNAQINLLQSNSFEKLPKVLYDVIIANPPYVGDDEMSTLPLEYTHEPDLALRATNNGLTIIENILKHAHEYLAAHGVLIMEVGNSQEELIIQYPEVPFIWLEFEYGGSGVLMLRYDELVKFYKFF